MQVKFLLSIVYKESQDFFATKLAVVYFGIFALILGIWSFYWGDILMAKTAQPMFLAMANLFVFFLPAVAMNIWHKDRQNANLEWLQSCGVKFSTLVLAKYVFLILLACANIVLSLPIIFALNLVFPLDFGLVLSAYLGELFLGSGIFAVAILFGVLAKNPLSTYILSLLVIVIFWLDSLAFVGNFLFAYLPDFMQNILQTLSFSQAFLQFLHGKISLNAMAFFIAISGLCLSLATIKLKDYNK